ncbi:MAG: CHASE2 domain-containing protein, partial [candidate division Zixibacteria bacterium]|nr:CHASE2 domain-containing protein [candidate division Zixibacteria bacterium]
MTITTEKRKMLWGGGAALLAMFFTVILGETLFFDIFQSFEHKTLDWRFSYRIRLEGEQPPIEDIVIVDIDERSLEKYGQFPWDRSYHADLVNYLNADGVLGIAFDIQFFDSPSDSEGQKKFIQALDECGRVINAVALYPEDKDHFRYAMKENPFGANIPPSENLESLDFTGFDRIEGPPKALADASAKLGFVNFFPDPDGVTRRTPLALKFSDDMAFPLSLTSLNVVFDNGSNPITYEDGYLYPAMGYSVPVDEEGDFIINFVGPPRSFRYISYYDVREKRLPPDYFNGKFVFVG